MRLPLLPALLLGLSAFAVPSRAAGPDEIARLVAALGSGSYAERQEATRALDAVGGPALEALRAAERGPDPEVRRRARDLVRRIERREEMARALRPQRLRLAYKDKPLREALDDFGRKAGVRIRTRGTLAGGADRRVTLDTGEVTYWEALDRFCAAARLSEYHQPEPVTPERQYLERRGGGRRILFLDRRRAAVRPPDDTVWLQDGEGRRWPTCQVGSVRVRLMSGANAAPRPEGASGDLPLLFDVRPEPRVGWEGLTALRIDQARDDRGRDLPRPAPYAGTEGGELVEEVILLTDGEQGLPTNQGRSQVVLTLCLGDRPCPRLRELRGSVSAWVRTPPGPLVAVDDVLKAKGRSARGGDGTLLKVEDVQVEAGGLCRLRLAVTPAPRVSDLVPAGARVRWINRDTRGRVLLRPREAEQPFALLDANGRPWKLAAGEYVIDPTDGITRQYTVTFSPVGEQKVPARLVARGRRTVFVEVPFTLKDVPLVQPAPRR